MIRAWAEDEFRIDFTNNVHIKPLHINVKTNKIILNSKIIWNLIKNKISYLGTENLN